MALDWQNPNYFTNQFHPFQQQHFELQDYCEESSLLETELLCLDPLPPTLFEFENPLFTHPPFQELDFKPSHYEDYLITPTNDSDSRFFDVDFPPQMQDIFGYDNELDYSTQLLPAPKKQKLAAAAPAPLPDIFAVPEFNHQTTNPNYHPYNYDGDGGGYYYGGANNYYYNEGNCGEDYCSNYDDYSKISSNNNNNNKTVSSQSKAARERRRKITEKTQELGKLIPGGHKMNTAEMFQAAANYVKFMQAQVGILQSINNLPKDDVKEAKLNNLPILTSSSVQEKLYGKQKCLVPLDLLTVLEQRCDSETISHQIRDLLH